MGIPSKAEMAAAFQSKDAFLDFIKAPDTVGDRPAVGKGRWTNRDLEPTPPEERNWEWYGDLNLYDETGC